MVNKFFIVFITIFSLMLGSCATIKLTQDGDKVRVLSPGEVSSCRKMGKTNTAITDSVLGINRPIESLKKELAIIGRNSAGDMGGDTIVPLTTIKQGRQTFVVYKCINP